MKRMLLVISICIVAKLSHSQTIRVAAAANTQFAMKEIVSLYESQTEKKVDLIVGSSGKLVAQIVSGAPYHIFISANKKYAENVYNNELASEPLYVYAKGSLVLWTTKEIDLSEGLKALANSQIKTIAIPSPKNAPYGRLAIDALNAIDIQDTIKEKLIFGSSVSQVNQYINLGTVDVGITAKSGVMAAQLKGVGTWSDIDGFGIDQAMVLLKYSETNAQDDTRMFYEFLQSKESRDIFEKHGYTVN